MKDNTFRSANLFITILSMSLGEMYQKAWKTIISPFRVKHKLSTLGPLQQTLDGKQVVRVDIQFNSINGKKLWGFLSYCPEYPTHDLVIYLHGNGGSKVDAVDMIKCTAKYQLAVAAFDFAGCGNSEDDYLTYGLNEADDVNLFLLAVQKHIRHRTLTVWGRSMGAVTAIMFADRYRNDVDCLVLDGPFTHLSTTVQRASYQASKLPMPIIKGFLYFVKRKVDQQLGMQFSIFSINYMDIFKKLSPHLSILFIYSNYDRIVPAAEVYEFYHAHKGNKETFEIYETHDEDRKETMFVEAVKWLKRTQVNRERNKLLQSTTYPTYGTYSRVLPNGCC